MTDKMKTWKMYVYLFIFTVIMLTIIRCSKGPLKERKIERKEET